MREAGPATAQPLLGRPRDEARPRVADPRRPASAGPANCSSRCGSRIAKTTATASAIRAASGERRAPAPMRGPATERRPPGTPAAAARPGLGAGSGSPGRRGSGRGQGEWSAERGAEGFTLRVRQPVGSSIEAQAGAIPRTPAPSPSRHRSRARRASPRPPTPGRPATTSCPRPARRAPRASGCRAPHPVRGSRTRARRPARSAAAMFASRRWATGVRSTRAVARAAARPGRAEPPEVAGPPSGRTSGTGTGRRTGSAASTS